VRHRRTLQGNWYEDRFQGTIGTNDGLRCIDTAYKEMMEGASTFAGLSDEVSMPATQFGNVTTQEPSVNLFPCLKYRHPKQVRPAFPIPCSAVPQLCWASVAIALTGRGRCVCSFRLTVCLPHTKFHQHCA
jgi:hypothetical protein